MARTLIKRKANQFDTISAMRKYALIGSRNPFFNEFIRQNGISPTLSGVRKVSQYIFDNVTFKKDNPRKQQIRYGTKALRDGIGNCVDYSVLLSEFLINLRIPHSFIMVATNKNEPANYNHIFVVLDEYNLPVDLVIGQDQTGKGNKKEMKIFQSVPYYKSQKLKVI